MRAPAALALLSLLGSCGPGEQEAPSAGPGTETPAARPTRDVLDATLAELGVSRREGVLSARELRGNRGLLPGELEGPEDPASPGNEAGSRAAGDPRAEPLDPEMIEFRDGLVGMVVSDGRYLETATGDVVAASAELAPALAAGLREADRPADELKVLVQFARSAPQPDTAAALVELAAGHDDATVRAFASWALVPAAGLEERGGRPGVAPQAEVREGHHGAALGGAGAGRVREPQRPPHALEHRQRRSRGLGRGQPAALRGGPPLPRA